MKRRMRAVPVAAGRPPLLAAGCRGSQDPARSWPPATSRPPRFVVSTKVAGTLESRAVDEGQAVSAGQELARIDTTDTRLALAAARAERAQAAAELRLRLAGARAEDVREARGPGGARRGRPRRGAAGPRADGGPARRRLGHDQGARRRAHAPRRGAARAWTRRASGWQRLAAGSRPEEIDAARARLEAADARIAQLEQQLQDAVIASPVAGVVTEKLAEQGELPARGTGIVVVTDLEDAWLNVYVAETDLARLRLGQEAEVVTDDGQTAQGHASRSSPRRPSSRPRTSRRATSA